MTKNQFKTELIADLQSQLEHKGKDYTSEYWYLSKTFYPLSLAQKKAAITELIADGIIERVSSVTLGHDTHFPMLLLND